MSNSFNFLKNKYKNWLSGTWQLSLGKKSGSLVNVALTSWQQQTDSWQGGHNAPPRSNRVKKNFIDFGIDEFNLESVWDGGLGHLLSLLIENI